MFNGNVFAQVDGISLNWIEVRKIVFRVASRLLVGDYQFWVEDTTQDVMIKLMHSLESYDESKGEFKAWVVRVTRNHCLDCIRKSKKSKEQRVENDADFRYLYDEDDYLEKESLIVKMETALNQLDERSKKLLVSQYYDEKSGREIASMVGMPEKNVPMYVKRARNKIKQLMDDKLAA